MTDWRTNLSEQIYNGESEEDWNGTVIAYKVAMTSVSTTSSNTNKPRISIWLNGVGSYRSVIVSEKNGFVLFVRNFWSYFL